MKVILTIFFLLPLILIAQENPLSIFSPLEEYVWTAEGEWGDGSKFKQEIKIEIALEGNLIKVESKGYTNKEQTNYGIRNYGIRQFDPDLEVIKFWEFDVFGGLTEGSVEGEGKNLIYKYEYNGTLVTEMWIYKNETSYDYIVGIYEDDKWTQKFLVSQFNGVKK